MLERRKEDGHEEDGGWSPEARLPGAGCLSSHSQVGTAHGVSAGRLQSHTVMACLLCFVLPASPA